MNRRQKRRVVAAGIATVALSLVAAGAGLGYAATSTTATRTVQVSTAAQLKSALAAAKAGDVIQLAAGSYDGAFFGTASGTASAPITLTGPRGAILSNTKNACDPNVPSGRSVTYCGFGFHLNRASFWKLSGFSVKSANKGIVLDTSSRTVIDGVEVSDVRDEGVHFRTSSTDNVLQNSSVHDTGKGQPGFGEGVYLGSAKNNWSKFGSGGDGVDHSDRNKVTGNKIGPGVAAELIDIKEGTVSGTISGNTFDGAGVSGANSADSWIDAKGNTYTINGNKGTGPGGDVDGYQTHQQVAGFGCGNVFANNVSKLSSTGFAINVTDQSKCGAKPNLVASSNTVAGAKSGLTNITVTG
jgi:nitrous oxidase accessory protein NosD